MIELSKWSKLTDPHYAQRSVLAFDMDDTLTIDGSLPAFVLEALEAVQKAGWLTVMVTGRSAGWVDALIKLLPFDAIVGENGALLRYWKNRKLHRKPREEAEKMFWTPAGFSNAAPTNIRDQHKKAAEILLKKFPRAQIASDQPYRVYDLAIDFAEEVDPPLDFDTAYRIKNEFEALGATAKVSSIHVNGWWGNFSKEDGLRELLEKKFNLSLDHNLIYTGDSPNDSPLFKVAGMSVGVANIKHFLNDPNLHLPKFVTQQEGGHGAVELLKMALARK